MKFDIPDSCSALYKWCNEWYYDIDVRVFTKKCIWVFTHCSLGDVAGISVVSIINTTWRLTFLISKQTSLWNEHPRISLMLNQHWFKWWFGAVRLQAITLTGVDEDLRRHMASQGCNKLAFPMFNTLCGYMEYNASLYLLDICQLSHDLLPLHIHHLYQRPWTRNTCQLAPSMVVHLAPSNESLMGMIYYVEG